MREALRAVAQGTYIPFLSKAEVEGLNVSLPPLETQQRVVQLDVLRRRERVLQAELVKLTDQYSDAVVWKAIASNTRKIPS
jgi:restriction endonuclease S subunit